MSSRELKISEKTKRIIRLESNYYFYGEFTTASEKV
jgi:hypothetical protein